MKQLTRVLLIVVSVCLLTLSSYLYIGANREFDDSLYVAGTDEIKYRYDTTNGYVGLDITLNSLVANSTNGKVVAENTKKLQEAMNKVSDAGGGTVYLPSGTFYFGRGGMNSSSEQEDFAIKCRNNVHLKGAGTNENSSSYTVLRPIYNSPSASGGMDMFYFNNYKDTGYGLGITPSTVRDVSHVDASGNKVTWKSQTVYLINADFSDFVIDGDSARGGIASQGGTYRTDGKGFMINLFADCDWNNVVVKNVDATGFGVDCPINSTIVNCKAINCGKAATKADGGASGFGIGTGYSNNESLVIDSCIALNNKKFGYFFEHQARFSNNHYKATASKGFVVTNSIAGGNMYDFGGLKVYDVSYENNKSVSNYATYSVSGLKATNTSSSGGYTALTFSGGKVKLNTVTQPIFYSMYSVNSGSTNTDVFSMLTDVGSYKNEVKWAVDSGIIPVNNATTFGVKTNVNRFDVVKALFAYKGNPGTVVPQTTTNDRNNAKSKIASIGFTDLSGSTYQDDLDAVIWAYNTGLVSKATKFNPTSNCSRAELVTMLYRLAGSPAVSGKMPFSDVKSGSWYYNSVLWGYNKGIIKGTDNGNFSPDGTVTKQQLAIFLHRFKTSSGVSFTIKYNLDGGSASNITTYHSNTSYTLKNPTRPGFTFLGWTGSNGTSPSKKVTISKGTTGNLSYTARWSPNLTNVFVKSMPKKTVYKVGDKLDTSGLVIGAKYGDNNIKEISGYSISPSTLDTAGTQTITVTYGGLSTTFKVTVNVVNVSKISIGTKPKKLTYYVGDNIDTTGLVLKVTYSDGTIGNVSSGFTISPKTLNKAGTQNVTVKYGDKSTSYSVTVNSVSITKLAIKTNPTKMNYFQGEYLDTTGLVLQATYNNGTVKDITAGYTLSVSKLDTLGSQTVTVKYSGKSCSFKVTVNEEKMVSIKVKELPNQTNYLVGDKFSSKGIKIVGLMNSSYEENISSSYSLSLKDRDKLNNSGVVAVTVKYNEFTTSFNINVKEPVPETIIITNNPDQTTFVVGEEFDGSGLVLEYVNADGSVSKVNGNYSLSIADGKVLDTEGRHDVTVSYNGKLTNFSIDVVKVLRLIVNDVDLKKKYKIGEEFDSKGLVVIAEYSNGIKQELNNQYKVYVDGGKTFTSAGNKVVNIKYGDVQASINVVVDNAKVNNINYKVFIIIGAIIVLGIIIIGIVNMMKPRRKVVPGSLFHK